VGTDKFSLSISGGVFEGPENATNTAELFLMSTTDGYERVTHDLGANFRSATFRTLLERLGSQAWAVPTGSHWPSAAEKSIELLRLELDALFFELPEISAKAVTVR
jgi:hypothetical protein